MTAQIKEIMQTTVVTVSSASSLDVLTQELSRHQISGAPVVDNGILVGVVSLTDIVKRLDIERTFALTMYDYYDGPFTAQSPTDELDQLATIVGNRLAHLTVKDIMNRAVKSVSPELSITEAAKLMLDYQVHRLLVVDQKLVGIVSASDFVRYCANLN